MPRESTVEEHRSFRLLLEAMSRPGTVQPLGRPEDGHRGALERLAASLLDAETTLAAWTPELEPQARALAAAHGCRLTAPGTAAFVLHTGPDLPASLGSLNAGTAEMPDGSATLVWLVEALDTEGGLHAWSGPGIRDVLHPRIEGISPESWTEIVMNTADYPLGVDLVFLDRLGQVMALPRSTRIEKGSP